MPGLGASPGDKTSRCTWDVPVSLEGLPAAPLKSLPHHPNRFQLLSANLLPYLCSPEPLGAIPGIPLITRSNSQVHFYPTQCNLASLQSTPPCVQDSSSKRKTDLCPQKDWWGDRRYLQWWESSDWSWISSGPWSRCKCRRRGWKTWGWCQGHSHSCCQQADPHTSSTPWLSELPSQWWCCPAGKRECCHVAVYTLPVLGQAIWEEQGGIMQKLKIKAS